MSVVLTLDLGTSATKAALWDGARMLALARVPIPTRHPSVERAEQDPRAWWTSALEACAAVRAEQPARYGTIEVVACCAARETFVLVDASLEPLTPGILWSDRRGEVGALGEQDPAAFRAATGVILDGACCAAKVAWLRSHEPAVWDATRWVLAPRDLVLARLTGQVLTDETLASRTGCYDLAGTVTVDDDIARRLPPVVAATTRVPPSAEGNAALGLTAAAEVVVGTGDRTCEALGSGATATVPMVSWGTTTNVSVPHGGPRQALPTAAAVSRAALGGFLVEAGLSASGAAIAWLGALTGRGHDALLDEAAAVPSGARGVVALPWLHGARAPWWRPDVHAAFVGLTGVHGPADLARATVEAVGFDVARSVELVAPEALALTLAGGGADLALWRGVLASATGLNVTRRAQREAGSVGARLVAAAARDETLAVDALNPVIGVEEPDEEVTAALRAARAHSDRLARVLLEL